MMKSEIITKLNEAESPFREEELSEESLLDVLNSSRYSLISNLSSHIAKALKKGAGRPLIETLESICLQDSALSENVLNELQLPAKILITYNPVKDEVTSSLNDRLSISYDVSEETKKSLLALAEDENLDIQLELVLDKSSFLTYREKVKDSEESLFNKVCKNSKVFVAAVACGMLISANSSAGTVVKEISHKKQVQKQQAFALKSINQLSVKLNAHLNATLEELNKSSDFDMARSAQIIQELSSEELDRLFINLNKSYHAKKIDSSRETLDSDKLETIMEVIRMYSKKRNAFTESVAQAIYKEAQARKVDYHIMTAIIMQESSFNFKVNSQQNTDGTHDMSITQINYERWEKEFERLGYEKLDKAKLKDFNYAIRRMGDILDIVKKRQRCQDQYWYACYHSMNLTPKMEYVEALNEKMDEIKQIEVNNTKQKILVLLENLKYTRNAKADLFVDVDLEKIDSLVASLTELEKLINSQTKNGKVIVAKND